jgi:hypothetical protein
MDIEKIAQKVNNGESITVEEFCALETWRAAERERMRRLR